MSPPPRPEPYEPTRAAVETAVGRQRHRRVVGVSAAAALLGGLVGGAVAVEPVAASAYGCAWIGGASVKPDYLCQDLRGESLRVDWSQAIVQRTTGFVCNLRARFYAQPINESYSYRYTSTQTNCQPIVASRTGYFNQYFTDGSKFCASASLDGYSPWTVSQCHQIRK